mmetsp:Transcript_43137/g.88287  ORF Transcript_43137/g.88287 Transcript_43137/m.88287 type:complete len:221 (-) Transcript_43137:145-807(-)
MAVVKVDVAREREGEDERERVAREVGGVESRLLVADAEVGAVVVDPVPRAGVVGRVGGIARPERWGEISDVKGVDCNGNAEVAAEGGGEGGLDPVVDESIVGEVAGNGDSVPLVVGHARDARGRDRAFCDGALEQVRFDDACLRFRESARSWSRVERKHLIGPAADGVLARESQAAFVLFGVCGGKVRLGRQRPIIRVCAAREGVRLRPLDDYYGITSCQ